MEPEPQAKDIGRIFYEDGQAWTVVLTEPTRLRRLVWKLLTSVKVGQVSAIAKCGR